MKPETPRPLFDVHAVNLKSGARRVLAERLTEGNAEAVVSMAVFRRGVELEYYEAVPTGTPTESPRK